jgi:hypothetical protein
MRRAFGPNALTCLSYTATRLQKARKISPFSHISLTALLDSAGNGTGKGVKAEKNGAGYLILFATASGVSSHAE